MKLFLFAGGESLETEGHLVSDEVRRAKGHPWKRNEESMDLTVLPVAACLFSFVPNGLCGRKMGWIGLMIQYT